MQDVDKQRNTKVSEVNKVTRNDLLWPEYRLLFSTFYLLVKVPALEEEKIAPIHTQTIARMHT